ncbi:MAG: tRNA-binding protein [Planctomycetota bacterium]
MPRPEPIAQADLRVGVIRTAKVNPKARNPSMVLEIDLGPLGVLTSSSQITNLYRPEDLPGRTVIVAAGLGARRVGGVKSHVLTLGVPTPDGITLLTADPGAKPGDPVF